MKNLLWIKSQDKGQVKSYGIESYIHNKINTIGDLWGIDYERNTEFLLNTDCLTFKGDKVDLFEFTNAIFFFCHPYINIEEYNYLLALEEVLVDSGVKVLNKPSRTKYAADKILFFEKAPYLFQVPYYQVIRSVVDIPDWEYPFIIRSSCDAVSRHTFIVNNIEEATRQYHLINQHRGGNVIAVKIIDHDVCYRVAMVGGEIDWAYACPSDEMFKRYTNMTSDSSLVVHHHNKINDMVKDTYFKCAMACLQQSLDIDTFVVDFTIVDDEICLFEINIGFGMAKGFVHELYSRHGINDFAACRNDERSAMLLERILQ